MAAIACITVPSRVLIPGAAAAIFVVATALDLQQEPSQPEQLSDEQCSTPQSDTLDSPPPPVANKFRLYRSQELERILAALRSDNPILVIGREGSGKTALADTVVTTLKDEGFVVASINDPSTPKHMLTEIAQQLGVDTFLERRVIPVHELKVMIAQRFRENTAFLVVDNAHRCDVKFRDWLKLLKRQETPMLLLATNPPRSDIFINIPRIELGRLPEYAIREIMEQFALEYGLNLTPNELARLQERTGGNPMLARKAIEEEYLGVDAEAGDHGQYVDGTPLILLAGVFFVMLRFVGLGTNNRALYIFGGILAAFFLGTSRLFYNLPKESQRIEPKD